VFVPSKAFQPSVMKHNSLLDPFCKKWRKKCCVSSKLECLTLAYLYKDYIEQKKNYNIKNTLTFLNNLVE